MSDPERPHGRAHRHATGAPVSADPYRGAAEAAEPFGGGRRAAVVTCSDRAAAGEYLDRAGPVLVATMHRWGFEAADAVAVPDGDEVARALARSLEGGAVVVLTTGGTGVSPRDLTPQVTQPLLDVLLPGIPEAVRAVGVSRGIPTSVLSRGVAGVSGGAVVVNLPGSVGAVRDGLDVLATVLPHLLTELGRGTEPAQGAE